LIKKITDFIVANLAAILQTALVAAAGAIVSMLASKGVIPATIANWLIAIITGGALVKGSPWHKAKKQVK
jgi:hypothetical protein